MKYLEIGFGNTWFLRTEFEPSSGEEYEVKGWVFPIDYHSLYFRLWLGKKVYILSTNHFFEIKKKPKNKFKLVLGISSYTD